MTHGHESHHDSPNHAPKSTIATLLSQYMNPGNLNTQETEEGRERKKKKKRERRRKKDERKRDEKEK